MANVSSEPNIGVEEYISPDEQYFRPLVPDLNDSIELDSEFEYNESTGTKKIQSLDLRPRISSKSMLRGLVERTENYNKNVDRRVMTDSRIAFEEEQLKGRTPPGLEKEIEQLSVSNQHLPTKGRGESFGKMRSLGDALSPPPPPNTTMFPNNNYPRVVPFAERFNDTSSINGSGGSIRHTISEEDSRSLSFQSPRRSFASQQPAPVKHHFDPATAYRGNVVPNYRYSYNPQAASSHPQPFPHLVPTSCQNPAPLVRRGQLYPKRPENNPQPPPEPKPLSHDYYKINLYGAAQEEQFANRIQKTVKHPGGPPRF